MTGTLPFPIEALQPTATRPEPAQHPDTARPPRAVAPSPPNVPPTLNHHLRPRGTNSRSVLQGYPSQGTPRFRSASSGRILRIFWHNPTACVPNIFPSPPFSSGSGRGPASEAHSFSQSALSPNSPVEWCAPAYAGQVLCYAFPPAPGSIASSPAHPKAPYVRPVPILQPCPFGGPVLSIEETSQRAW